MKKIIFTDCHKNSGSFEWPGEFEYGPNVVMLQDNHEMKNIKKSDSDKALKELGDHVNKCKETGTIIVASNHGCFAENALIDDYDRIEDDCCYTHGHRVVYSEKKAYRWEHKPTGISWYKLLWIRSKNGKFKESKWKEPSESLKKKLAAYATDLYCNKIVVGHFHTKWIGEYDGVKIFMCGRGRTEIEI